jgi:hypothetical protein
VKPPSIEHWTFIAAQLAAHHKRNGRRRQALWFLQLYRRFHREKMDGAAPDPGLVAMREGEPYHEGQGVLPLFAPQKDA